MLKHEKGFTIFELLVTVALIGILASVAIPNLTFFIHNQYLMASTKDIQAGLTKAKGLAVARNEIIYVQYNGKAWELYDSTDSLIESYTDNSPAHVNATFLPDGASRLTYNAFGMPIANTDGTSSIDQIDISSSAGFATMSYRLIINGGSSRLCEPNRPTDDARRC